MGEHMDQVLILQGFHPQYVPEEGSQLNFSDSAAPAGPQVESLRWADGAPPDGAPEFTPEGEGTAASDSEPGGYSSAGGYTSGGGHFK